MTATIAGRPIVSGTAEGAAIVTDVPLSFWGGFDPATGEVIDRHHPLLGRFVSGAVLVFPHGRGSCSASGVLLEAIRNGTAPAAIVVTRVDPIVGLGAILAEELYGQTMPVVLIPPQLAASVVSGSHLAVDRQGTIRIERDRSHKGAEPAAHLALDPSDADGVAPEATMASANFTSVSRIINAAPERVFAAFIDRDALLRWLPPGEMTGVFHAFDPRPGGDYRLSLFYPAGERSGLGKTSPNEDVVEVTFQVLEPPRTIVESVTFVSDNRAFHGEMTLTATFEAVPAGTTVTLRCDNLPPGLRPEDNETGSRLSLDQLARYLELEPS